MDTNERIIVKYTNRKLYDVNTSSYVTLVKIADMLAEGENIKIIEHRTKKDITSKIFVQAIFEKHKKTEESISVDKLRSIFKVGSDPLNTLFNNI